MSALYIMRYLGADGVSFGSIYIGKGIFTGVDVANGRYNGTYTEAGGQMTGQGVLSAPPGGATLVTGDVLPEGQTTPLQMNWPANFADGSPQSVSIMGNNVQVTFEKVGDIP